MIESTRDKKFLSCKDYIEIKAKETFLHHNIFKLEISMNTGKVYYDLKNDRFLLVNKKGKIYYDSDRFFRFSRFNVKKFKFLTYKELMQEFKNTDSYILIGRL